MICYQVPWDQTPPYHWPLPPSDFPSVLLSDCPRGTRRLSRVRGMGVPNSSVTFGDSNFLVVWSDYAHSRYIKHDIYGVRISTQGVIIDTTTIPITLIKNRQGLPETAFDGTNYFVVWVDARKRRFAKQIYGTRITTDGILLDKREMPSFDELKRRRLEKVSDGDQINP